MEEFGDSLVASRNVVGVAVVDKEVFSRRTADYQAWVEAFARNHRLPIEWAERGVRKEDQNEATRIIIGPKVSSRR